MHCSFEISFNIICFIVKMHLTPIQRIKVVNIFNKFNDASCGNKAHRVSELAKQMSIDISEQGVRNIIKKWHKTNN